MPPATALHCDGASVTGIRGASAWHDADLARWGSRKSAQGRYVADAPLPVPGQWDLTFSASAESNDDGRDAACHRAVTSRHLLRPSPGCGSGRIVPSPATRGGLGRGCHQPTACLHCNLPTRQAAASAAPAVPPLTKPSRRSVSAATTASAFSTPAFARRAPTPPNAGTSRSYVTTRADGTHELILAVDGLQCGACVWLIESVLAREADVVAGPRQHDDAPPAPGLARRRQRAPMRWSAPSSRSATAWCLSMPRHSRPPRTSAAAHCCAPSRLRASPPAMSCCYPSASGPARPVACSTTWAPPPATCCTGYPR